MPRLIIFSKDFRNMSERHEIQIKITECMVTSVENTHFLGKYKHSIYPNY
jgi:hypothetical protein